MLGSSVDLNMFCSESMVAGRESEPPRSGSLWPPPLRAGKRGVRPEASDSSDDQVVDPSPRIETLTEPELDRTPSLPGVLVGNQTKHSGRSAPSLRSPGPARVGGVTRHKVGSLEHSSWGRSSGTSRSTRPIHLTGDVVTVPRVILISRGVLRQLWGDDGRPLAFLLLRRCSL